MSMKKGQLRKWLDGAKAKPLCKNIEEIIKECIIFRGSNGFKSIAKANYEKSTIDMPGNGTQ